MNSNTSPAPALSPYNSFLQAEVDKLRSAGLNRGGLFVLGSLHSEMSALLETRPRRYTPHPGSAETGSLGLSDLMSVFRNQEFGRRRNGSRCGPFSRGAEVLYDAFEAAPVRVRH